VPDSVCRTYGVTHLEFGADYLIPTPFDPRVLVWASSAVAQAAMDSGAAQERVEIGAYRDHLEHRLSEAEEVSRGRTEHNSALQEC
jgi:malate dehydrogenase (oxaloacetate-decarboxylating)(NADP+)